MAFLREREPRRGVRLPVLPGITRIVAPNPSVMTYHGTNTYLLQSGSTFSVLDPGPDIDAHVQAVIAATSGRVSKILLSHTHHDHLGACSALQEATGAPIYGFHCSAEPTFSPDVPLAPDDEVDGLVAIHTPGHARDHLCFARLDGVVFTADHVMSWSSSIVSPPSGDMAAYFASLRRMIARNDVLYLPGHGPPLPNPRPFVEELLAHRIAREEEIARTLRQRAMTPAEVAEVIYAETDPWLKRAAERNVIAHLRKLAEEGRVRQEGDHWIKISGATRAR